MTAALSPSRLRQLHLLPQLRRSLLPRPSQSTPWRSMLCCQLRAFSPAMATVPVPKRHTLRALFSHERPASGLAARNSGNAAGRGRSSSSVSSGSSGSSSRSSRSSSGGSNSRSSVVSGEDIFSANGFVRTVEVCTGSAGPWEHLPGGEARAELLRQGVFHAAVFPDLPAVASLRELFSSQWPFAATSGSAQKKKKKEKGKETKEHGQGTGGANSIAAGSSSSNSTTTTTKTTSSAGKGNATEMPVDPSVSATMTSAAVPQGVHGWEVRTVAAQTRTLQQLQQLMVERSRLACGKRGIAAAAAGADEEEYHGEGCEEGGGALLLLSGGHPLRSVPVVGSMLPSDSVKMIRAARDMRDRLHLLPRGLQIWGVENPNCNNLDRLKRKVDAGAEAVLLQPPLLPEAFATWWLRAHDAGLTSAVRLVVGVPVISSSRNLAFWNFLAGVDGSRAEAVAEADLFKRGESECAEDAAAFGAFRREWALRYIRMAKDLPGAAGIHIMPVSKRGWKDLSNMIVDNEL